MCCRLWNAFIKSIDIYFLIVSITSYFNNLISREECLVSYIMFGSKSATNQYIITINYKIITALGSKQNFKIILHYIEVDLNRYKIIQNLFQTVFIYLYIFCFLQINSL